MHATVETLIRRTAAAAQPFRAELIVERYLSGIRVDHFLATHFRNYTPFRMQRMVCAGFVSIDGHTAWADSRIYTGQRVAVKLVEPPDKLLDAEPLPLEIIHEDPWLVVVNKAAGQITHPVGTRQTGTLCNALQHHLDGHTRLRGLLRPGIVHRLDMFTSGIIVATKEHLSHRRLSIAFQRGKVRKEYLAVVEGRVPNDEGLIDLPIGQWPSGDSVLMSCAVDARAARPARTAYRVMERFRDASLVRALPLTGRNHQIRVHLAAIGHPVLGDEFYAAHGALREAAGNGIAAGVISRQALHASRIAFEHPILGEYVEFTSPLPSDMVVAVARLRSEK